MVPEDFTQRLEMVTAGQCSPEVTAEYEHLNRRWEAGDFSAMDEMIQLLALADVFFTTPSSETGRAA